MSPMQRVKMPKVPLKIVPTFSESEMMKLLAVPDRNGSVGFLLIYKVKYRPRPVGTNRFFLSTITRSFNVCLTDSR